METRCINCQCLFVIKRNPNQRYCSKTECQRARKHSWQKQKIKNDNDYQDNQKQANKHWRSQHSGYWQTYRERNPAYTQRNREQSKLRKERKKRMKDKQIKVDWFAKMDALNPIKTEGYPEITISPRFAKMDAFTLIISIKTNA